MKVIGWWVWSLRGILQWLCSPATERLSSCISWIHHSYKLKHWLCCGNDVISCHMYLNFVSTATGVTGRVIYLRLFVSFVKHPLLQLMKFFSIWGLVVKKWCFCMLLFCKYVFFSLCCLLDITHRLCFFFIITISCHCFQLWY